MILFCSITTEPPSRPIIVDGTSAHKEILGVDSTRVININEGSDVKLICIAKGGRPRPRVIWFLENTVIDDSYEYRPEQDQTVNHLSYSKIERHHDNVRLVCQTSNTNLVAPQNVALVLDLNRKFQLFSYLIHSILITLTISTNIFQ